MIGEPLTPLQIELLKLYSTKIKKSELEEVKQVLAHHFAQKAITGADKVWEEKNLSNDEIDEWIADE